MKPYEQPEIVHRSVNERRLPSNPAEAVFLKEWQDQQRVSHTLQWILCASPDGSQQERELTQAEATCAATLMQWLGSPVGRCWLDETLKKVESTVAAARKKRL